MLVAALADHMYEIRDLVVRGGFTLLQDRSVVRNRLVIRTNKVTTGKDVKESMNINPRKRGRDENVPQRILAEAPPGRSPSPRPKSNTQGHGTAPAQDTGRTQSPVRSFSGSVYGSEELVGDLVLTNQHERVKTSRKAGLEAIRQAREYGDKADTARSASIVALHRDGVHAMAKFHNDIHKNSELEKQQIDEAVQHHEQAHAATMARNKMKCAGWRYIQGPTSSSSE